MADGLNIVALDKHPPLKAGHNPSLIVSSRQVANSNHDEIIKSGVIAANNSQLEGRIHDQGLPLLLIPQLALGQSQGRGHGGGQGKRPVGGVHKIVVDLLHGSLQHFGTGGLSQVIGKIQPDHQHILVPLRDRRFPGIDVEFFPAAGADSGLRAKELVAELHGIFLP